MIISNKIISYNLGVYRYKQFLLYFENSILLLIKKNISYMPYIKHFKYIFIIIIYILNIKHVKIYLNIISL